MTVPPPTPEEIRAWDRELRDGGTVALSGPRELRDAVVLAVVRRIRGCGVDDTDAQFGEQAMALVSAALTTTPS